MQGKPKKHKGSGAGRQEDTANEAMAEVSLRAAREACGKTIDEVANELRLSRDVVLALEAGDFEKLGAPVFVRGHLRSYAKLLGLSEDEINVELEHAEPEPEEFRTLSAQKEVKPGASLPNFVLWLSLVAIIVIAAIYLLIGDAEVAPDSIGAQDFSASVAPEQVTIAEPELEALPEAVEPAADELGLQQEQEAVFTLRAAEADMEEAEPDTQVATEAPTEVLAGVAVPPVPSPEQPVEIVAADEALVALTLQFSAECWVEVADAQRRLLYGLKKPGAEVQLEGEPPFRIFFGNAAAVTMELEGKPFAIPRSAELGGKTARFAISENDLAQ